MESPAVRRRTMQAVKSRDTAPELTVRRMLHANGYRYRVHRADLAGCPDIVFPSRRKVIFINGCFWHGHNCARGSRVPKANAAYWIAKVARNRARDVATKQRLEGSGWSLLVIWECELKDEGWLLRRLNRFLR